MNICIHKQSSCRNCNFCKFSNCSISPIDNEDFNFFPMSFLCYIIFTTLLCLVIISVKIMEYRKTHQRIDDIIFGNNMIFNQNSFNQNSISKLHTINISDPTPLYIYISDHIIIYGIMILAIWDSLFSC